MALSGTKIGAISGAYGSEPPPNYAIYDPKDPQKRPQQVDGSYV